MDYLQNLPAPTLDPAQIAEGFRHGRSDGKYYENMSLAFVPEKVEHEGQWIDFHQKRPNREAVLLTFTWKAFRMALKVYQLAPLLGISPYVRRWDALVGIGAGVVAVDIFLPKAYEKAGKKKGEFVRQLVRYGPLLANSALSIATYHLHPTQSIASLTVFALTAGAPHLPAFIKVPVTELLPIPMTALAFYHADWTNQAVIGVESVASLAHWMHS